MKKTFTLKNIITIFLGVAVLSLLVVVVMQKYRLNNIYNNNEKNKNIVTSYASSENISLNTDPISKELRIQYEENISQLKSQISEIQSSIALPKEGFEESSPPPGETEPFNDRDPFMEKEQDYQRRAQFASIYEPFLEDLGLTVEDILKVNEIYSDCILKEKDINNNWNNFASDEERVDYIKSLIDEYNNSILDVLGASNAEKYQLLENSLPQRHEVEAFNSTLDITSQLEQTQIEELTMAFYEINDKYYKNTVRLHSISYTTIDSDEELQLLTRAEKKALMKEEYNEIAKRTLNNVQYELFEAFFSQTSGMNM